MALSSTQLETRCALCRIVHTLHNEIASGVQLDVSFQSAVMLHGFRTVGGTLHLRFNFVAHACRTCTPDCEMGSCLQPIVNRMSTFMLCTFASRLAVHIICMLWLPSVAHRPALQLRAGSVCLGFASKRTSTLALYTCSHVPVLRLQVTLGRTRGRRTPGNGSALGVAMSGGRPATPPSFPAARRPCM